MGPFEKAAGIAAVATVVTLYLCIYIARKLAVRGSLIDAQRQTIDALRFQNASLKSTAEHERLMHLFFVEMADSWRGKFEKERDEYSRFVGTIIDRVQRGVPLVQPTEAESVGEDEVHTPTVAQADRMAFEATRRARDEERAARLRRERAGEDEPQDFSGMEPLAVSGDRDLPPVQRLDAGDEAGG